MRRTNRLVVGTVVLFAATSAASTNAEPARWAYYFNLGAGAMNGGFESALEKARTGEFGIERGRDHWRYGLGLSFGSWRMPRPYDRELEWGFQRVYLSGTRQFRTDHGVRPYVQARLGLARLHPRSELFTMDPLPDGFEIGDSPTRASNGVSVGLVPGLEWQVSRDVAVDASLLLDYFNVSRTDLSPIGRGSASSAIDWQARLGLRWWTDGGPDEGTHRYDAWGVRRSPPWAIGEALAINFGASAFNEYVRNANFNQISPRSWRENLREGFTFDDNEFTTNQFIHPFNGSQYYNAARANGLSLWPSYAIALAGAYHWEVMGETHPVSFNDLISTGVGGAAMGEAMYRLSSMMLDNEATGARRLLREAGGFIVDPIRGLNRVVSGRAWKVHGNPSDDMDTNPERQINDLSVGWRRIGDGRSLERNVSDTWFARYWHEHGNVFDNSRRGPYDYFDFDGRVNFGDKSRFGRLVIEGNWWTGPVGERRPAKHMAAIRQYFEYINNNAFEFGGQSVGAALFSRWGSLGPVGMETRADLMGTLLGAVNSDLSELAVVADRERLREYDYGPGAGGAAKFVFKFKGGPVLDISYRLHFLYVTNGSIYQPGERDSAGLDAQHWLHGVDARFETPTARGIGLGIEYSTFVRESHYKVFATDPSLALFSLTVSNKQVNPEIRVYVRYRPWGG